MPPNSAKPIFLLGFMGAGKSTTGRILAKKLNRRFLDTDILVEILAKKTIAQIFAENGEAVFRDLETDALVKAASATDSIIATGGGVVSREINRQIIKRGISFYLETPFETIWQRIHHDPERPLAQTDKIQLKELLDARIVLYRETATHIIDCADHSPEAISEIISQLLTQDISA